MMKTLRSSAAPAAGAAMIMASGAAAVDTPPSWETPQPVATISSYFTNFDAYQGQNRYLAFDHFGDPGIGYALGSQVYYARFVPGVGWDSLAIDTMNGFVAGQPGLVFDLAERPAMCYLFDIFNPVDSDGIDAAFFDGVAWQTSGVTSSFPGTNFVLGEWGPSNALGIVGQAMIATTRGGALLFAEDTDGDGLFNDEIAMQIYSGAAGGDSSCSLAVDPIGRPMIAAAHGSGAEIRFAARDTGSGWSWISVANDGEHPSLAIDPATGFPAFAYHEGTTSDLRYASWTGTNWTFTTVDSTGTTGLWPSLAFDPADGNPAIAYHDQTGGDLNFAWFDGAIWNTQTVVNGTNKVPFGYNPSLAFNPFGNGFPSIAYVGIDQTLYYVADPPLLGDLDDDGGVDVLDLLILLSEWGAMNSPADLDGDGFVAITDLLILLANWT